ncbi:coiled-coil domain-containing protein 75 [Arthroderma uncinatum]|uniref:coiled-coil domain-containing protein 75 n=1 Tax=Arthroderma uncinatum TaxID=74035 RepID=UPI00144ADDF5|nr:coiled-coil domain-containing protein 75 [Arthroderma uncinatum]KAF3482086.1 coiled-coil domain-containing protein 75 [Arthroderma uncinatum]
MPVKQTPGLDGISAKRRQDDSGEEEEDDYMSMSFLDEPQAKKETFTQKKLRKLREAEEKSRVPSKAELAAAEAARREAALSTSAIDTSSKGYQMMAKLGYKPGSALGKKTPSETAGTETDQRLTEPLGISVKENRGGIGLDTEKKRKFREELEGEAKRVKAVESDYLERVRTEREEKRQEGQFHAAQKVIERFDTENDEDGTEATNINGNGQQVIAEEGNSDDQDATAKKGKTQGTRPIARVNILYRGLVRAREVKLREQQAIRRRYESLSSRDSSQLYSEKIPGLPTFADDELEVDDKLALGRTAEGEVVEVEADDEDDEELEQFNSLGVQERLSRAVAYLRDKYNYCFWCKYRYELPDMEGCPGLTEEDHD